MLYSITTIFNTRELATIGWVMIFFIWMLLKQKSKLPKLLLNLIKTIVVMWKIILPMIGYIAITIFLLQEFLIWNNNLTKITIFWFFGWAFITLMNSSKLLSEKGYIKKVVHEILGLTVLISFITNFYTFSIWFEIIIVPFFVLLGGLIAYTDSDNKYKNVNTFMNWLAIILGVIFLGMNIYKTIINWDDFAAVDTLQEFTLPVLLSLMFIPFACILSIYNKWNQKRVIDQVRAENRAKK